MEVKIMDCRKHVWASLRLSLNRGLAMPITSGILEQKAISMFAVLAILASMLANLSLGHSQPSWGGFSKLRLCTGSPTMSPFVQGVYIANNTVARVTVFDVEVLSGFKPGTSTVDSESQAMMSVLAFLETYDSIQYTQWNPNALAIAVSSRLAEQMSLKCSFLSEDEGGAEQLVHASYASVLLAPSDRFVNFHCPLPTVDLTSSPKLKLKLSLQTPTAQVLHLEPLPLCRHTRPPKASQPSDLSSDLAPLPAVHYSGSGSAGPSAADVAVASSPPSNTSAALCVRPYHEHHYFSTRAVSKSDDRLLEFINFHLLLGVNRLYFYDRYGTEKKKLLQPYIDRGLLVYVPFPVWSEVFYRKDAYDDAVYPYNFPLIYDQVLVYEHCLLQGRRNGDTWMLFTDTDEFLWYPEKAVGALPGILEAIAEEHRAAQRQTLGAMYIQRFNFGGGNESGIPVLDSCTKRCKGPIYNLIYHSNGEKHIIAYKDKLAAQPSEMIGSIIEVHRVSGKVERSFVGIDSRSLRINHYSSAPFSEYKGEKGTAVGSLCNKVEDPWQLDFTWEEDRTLLWAAERIAECTKSFACKEYTKGECGSLCPIRIL